MARRKRAPKTDDPAAREDIDETEWEDWWKLRRELERRLGGRDATGTTDESDEADRPARARSRRR